MTSQSFRVVMRPLRNNAFRLLLNFNKNHWTQRIFYRPVTGQASSPNSRLWLNNQLDFKEDPNCRYFGPSPRMDPVTRRHIQQLFLENYFPAFILDNDPNLFQRFLQMARPLQLHPVPVIRAAKDRSQIQSKPTVKGERVALRWMNGIAGETSATTRTRLSAAPDYKLYENVATHVAYKKAFAKLENAVVNRMVESNGPWKNFDEIVAVEDCDAIGRIVVNCKTTGDFAVARTLQSSVIFYPVDAVSAERAVELASRQARPAVIRTSRQKTPIVYSNNEEFSVGKAKIVRAAPPDKAANCVVIAAGKALVAALQAAEELADYFEIETTVIDPFTIKPIDAQTIGDAVIATGGKMVVAEDNYAHGGIGEAVLAALTFELTPPVWLSSVRHLAHQDDSKGDATTAKAISAAVQEVCRDVTVQPHLVKNKPSFYLYRKKP